MAFARAFAAGCCLLVLAGLATSLGCSSDEDNGPIVHSLECSTGPARTQTPPQGMASRRNDVPQCVPRCGETTVQGPFPQAYALSGLPSGACTAGDRCQMTVAFGAHRCGNVTVGCDLSGAECACTAGEWQCVATSYGGGVCGCEGFGGVTYSGVDAGPDGH